MLAKERREMGRRTLWNTQEETRWQGVPVQRLPALPPPGHKDVYEGSSVFGEGSRRSVMHLKDALVSSSTSGEKRLGPRALKAIEQAGLDICEGLRVLMLGQSPSEVEELTETALSGKKEAELALATEDRTLKVYKTYRSLLETTPSAMAGPSPEGGPPAGTADPPGGIKGDAPEENFARGVLEGVGGAAKGAVDVADLDDSENGELEELSPITWPRLFRWAQHKDDTAFDFRRKSLTAGLLRALALWFRYHADPEQRRDGVKLDQLFRWIWPQAEEKELITMFTWVCLHELDKIRQPVPPVIDNQERRTLEGIFATMADGKDHTTPEDIAGGADVDKNDDATMRNIVDAGTVRAVAGKDAITTLHFLEMMCEDGCRAHVDAVAIQSSEGGRILKHRRPGLGIEVWFTENPPKEELPQRALVDAVEAEVIRWQQLAEARREREEEAKAAAAAEAADADDAYPSPILSPEVDALEAILQQELRQEADPLVTAEVA
jgi:hypothetical protein